MRIVHQVDVLGLRWLLCSGSVWLVFKPGVVHAVRPVLGRVDVLVANRQGTRVPQHGAPGIELQAWVSARPSHTKLQRYDNAQAQQARKGVQCDEAISLHNGGAHVHP